MNDETPASTDEITTIVKAKRKARRYDEERGCYVYDVSFKTSTPLTDRTIEVSRTFGLGVDEEKEHVLYRDFELRLAEGDVVYITGDSGSGKSVLLRAIEADLGGEAANIDQVEADRDTPIIDTVGQSFKEALGLLSRVGLNDAFLFLRRYRELNDGQRYRYRIARMIDGGRRFWLADEFCSTLDRTTAKIVAYNIQKLARRSGATLIVATTHDDLGVDLSPSVCVRKGWGEEIEVDYGSNVEAPRCTVVEGITVREGTREDYRRLGHLHYRNERLPVPREIYAMERKGELVGVIVYSYPAVRASGRKKAVGYSPDLKELNREWAVISRVIVHPKYRTIGLGTHLIRETLPMQGCGHVELIAVMAQYNPFAEKAGMKLVQITEPHKSVTRALEELHHLGFNPIILSFAKQNRETLNRLDREQRASLRQMLLAVNTVYYKRLSRASKPYIRKAEFQKWLEEQPNESLARTLSTLSTLSQTKAYLYWNKDMVEGGGGVKGMNEENAPFNEWLEDFRQFADETAQKCAPKQRKWVRFRTQTIRKWFVNSLSELYESALEQSKNTELTVTQKERWSRLTAYIAQTINVILNAYDEVAIEKAIHDLKEYVKKHVETP